MRGRARSVITVAMTLISGVLAGLGLPAAAGAYATNGPEALFSSAPGLPDGRVYEMVSPLDKHGYEAGANVTLTEGIQNKGRENGPFMSVASPDGDAVSFGASGPAAEVDVSGLDQTFVAQRAVGGGWSSRASRARGLGTNKEFAVYSQNPFWLYYSADLSHLAYVIEGPQVTGAPQMSWANFYLLGPNPFERPTWLARPTIESPSFGFGLSPLGGTPDLSTIYFAYEKALLPGEEERTGWGLYEYKDGALSPAGVLPDGSVPAQGAAPAAEPVIQNVRRENTPDAMANQVSNDGKRIFFVSPDPEQPEGPVTTELYVRITEPDGTHLTKLVSGSELPGHVGEPAADGVQLMGNPARNAMENSGEIPSMPIYAYASPDGSHVFFTTEDRLTSTAPNDTSPKMYDFDVDTGSLDYLNVKGEIVVSATDGSWFAFDNPGAATPELDRWSAGPEGGTVSQIVQLPGGGFLGPVRIVGNGASLVFQTSSPIAGFNDGGSHMAADGEHSKRVPGSEQIFRYDFATNVLTCVSCPPAGEVPTGRTYISSIDAYRNEIGIVGGTSTVNDDRGVSADGSRVFFDTPDSLVPQDTNGVRDVYEWENGKVFLLSTGTDRENAFLLDNSESGDDVFFATTAEIRLGDDDGTYDVYDARVPRPSDNPPPSAVPCQGEVCQGPPSVSVLLGTPASATFNGLGNLSPVARKSARRVAIHGQKRKKHRKRSHKAKIHRRSKKSDRRGK